MTAPANRAELLRMMADHVWEQERNRKITEYWRATADYDAIVVRMRTLLHALEAAGCSVVPNVATEEMICTGDEAIIVSLNEHPADPQFSKGTPAECCYTAMLAAGPFREG